MIERLDFGEQTPYNAVEATIHLNRYSMVKFLCKGKRNFRCCLWGRIWKLLSEKMGGKRSIWFRC